MINTDDKLKQAMIKISKKAIGKAFSKRNLHNASKSFCGICGSELQHEVESDSNTNKVCNSKFGHY